MIFFTWFKVTVVLHYCIFSQNISENLRILLDNTGIGNDINNSFKVIFEGMLHSEGER